MKIREIRSASLRGETPLGVWANEPTPEVCIHTLIAVLGAVADRIRTGYASKSFGLYWLNASADATRISMNSSICSFVIINGGASRIISPLAPCTEPVHEKTTKPRLKASV